MLIKETIEALNEANIYLAKKIRKIKYIRSSSDKAYSFIITVLKLIKPGITFNELMRSITDCQRDAGFDAICIAKQEKTVSVFSVDRTKSFRYDYIKLLRDNIRLYFFNEQQSLDGLADIVKKRIVLARKNLRERDWSMKIYVVRKTVDLPHGRTVNLLESLRSHFQRLVKDIAFLNTEELIKKSLSIKAYQKRHFPWEITVASGYTDNFEDKIVIKNRSNGPIKSMFARIKLEAIVKLQREFINQNLDLFDANVRDFQKKKTLSKKIVKSIEESPKDFYVFHNGLTFSCSGIDPLTEFIYLIHDPQVINGCQTVNAIYEAYKDDARNPKLKQSAILCRFYVLKGKAIEKVCEATNTQVKISLWDLRTNDRIQKILEHALSAKGINYKRKGTSRANNTVLITDLAQWIHSCKFKKPAEAKNNKSKLFDLFAAKSLRSKSPYESIFNERLRLDVLCRICEIALFVREKIGKLKKPEHSFEKNADLHYAAGIFKLEDIDKTLNWKYNKVNSVIKQAIRQLKRKYGDDITPNQMFSKKDETWKIIERKLSTIT